MRGAIYSRVSTEQQDYNKQTNELKEYASKNGIEIVAIFEEKESGFKDDRPEFEKLRKLTKEDIDIVLVWEISRISRRAIYLQQQVQEFTEKGICIYAKKEGLSTLNPNGTVNSQSQMMIGFVSIIAEQEASTLKARTISGMRNKILNEGKSYTSVAPFGYDYNKDTKQLSINEKEAEVLRRIFQMSIDGYSTYRIPVILNSEGITTKKGYKWNAFSIRDILKNPVYMGKARYCLKDGNKKEFVSVDTPAIISKEMYEESLDKMKGRTDRSKSSGTKHFPLLRGLIVCPKCGWKYVWNNSLKVYLCHNKTKEQSCHSKSIGTNLEIIVWDIVKRFFSKELAIEKAQEQIKPLQTEFESIEGKILLLDGQISKLTEEAKIIVETAIDLKKKYPNMPILYENELKKVDSINKEVTKYQNEKNILLKRKDSIAKRIKNINKIDNETSLVDSITDETQKYELVHKVIDKIMIFGEKKTSIIIITFTTGQTIYIGYYSKKNSNYYVLFYPSYDISFDIQTSKGKIHHLKEKAQINSDGSIYLGDLIGEFKEYGVEDFIKSFDTEEFRIYY